MTVAGALTVNSAQARGCACRARRAVAVGIHVIVCGRFVLQSGVHGEFTYICASVHREISGHVFDSRTRTCNMRHLHRYYAE